jgi:endonuclease/exonuclease/phosphatase family metal-dependent hydrolase
MRILLLLGLGLIGLTGTSAQNAQDTVVARTGFQLWIKTETKSQTFPMLAGNKSWDHSEIIDTTSNHALGKTLASGKSDGWAIALTPSGSWSWNIGNGKSRLDYRPSVERQPIADGDWHLLSFTHDSELEEARLYYDGRQVAVYSTPGFGFLGSDFTTSPPPASELLSSSSAALDAAQVLSTWRERFPETEAPGPPARRVDELKVLAWNIWHGGRRDGNEAGLAATVAAIQASGADIICMQETYGSGARIADALGFDFYLRSTNLSVMSRYPIRETHPLYQGFRLGGVTIELPGGQLVRAFSLWINHLPSWDAVRGDEPPTAQQLVDADNKTRGNEIRAILAALDAGLPKDDVPLIVAGDYNSPSHLDWTEGTSAQHAGLVVPWPVSSAMAGAGFTDAFRAVHLDPVKLPARTWSPRFTEAMQDRIDYVYLRGAGMTPTAARMIDEQEPRWPSDHAAVLVTLALK